MSSGTISKTAEAVRFELTMGCPIPVFETGALDQLCDASVPGILAFLNFHRKMLDFADGPIVYSIGRCPSRIKEGPKREDTQRFGAGDAKASRRGRGNS